MGAVFADENASGELDFNEFLVGLWNICTFEEESLLRCKYCCTAAFYVLLHIKSPDLNSANQS